MSLITINEFNYGEHLNPSAGGTQRSTGLVPRNFAYKPVGSLYFAAPFSANLIDPSEWDSRLQALQGSQLHDYRKIGNNGSPIPSRDQDGWGYCWAHSPISATLAMRAFMGLPYVDLSAFYVGCKVKNYRNRGGDCTESIEFLAAHGCPTSAFWPQQSHDPSRDNEACQSNALEHVVLEWQELDSSNPEVMLHQFITCLLLNWPVVTDLNWWSHSICTLSLLGIDSRATSFRSMLASLRTRFWNSWGDSYSENGEGVLEGRHALPDNAIALCVTRPSLV